MELMNCKNCKRLFNYITGEQICPACKTQLENKFQEVKEYIKENPGSNIADVAEACETTVKQIKRWVREERLSFTDDSLVGLECERCGKMIHSGRFCKDCAGGLADAMTSAFREQRTYKKPTGSAKGKMHFLD